MTGARDQFAPEDREEHIEPRHSQEDRTGKGKAKPPGSQIRRSSKLQRKRGQQEQARLLYEDRDPETHGGARVSRQPASG